MGDMFMSHEMIDNASCFPIWTVPAVFKTAVVKFEVIMGHCKQTGTNHPIFVYSFRTRPIFVLLNLQQKLKLSDEQVYNNIQKYGN